jgi:hypothetical protein
MGRNLMAAIESSAVPDLGPMTWVGRGKSRKLIPLRHGRGETETEDAPDPDAPNRTIRRSRVVWTPDVWLARGMIGRPEHDAAMRYHDAYALGVLGARSRSEVAVRGGYFSALSEAQLDAAADYREATRAVGLLLSPALAWCVLSTGTVQGWADSMGWHNQRAAGLLSAALDRLAAHYGY